MYPPPQKSECTAAANLIPNASRGCALQARQPGINFLEAQLSRTVIDPLMTRGSHFNAAQAVAASGSSWSVRPHPPRVSFNRGQRTREQGVND